MKDSFDVIGKPLDPREERGPEERPGEEDSHSTPSDRSTGQDRSPRSSGAPGLWTVVDLLIQRWRWLVPGCLLGAGLFFLLGWRVVQPKFTATAQLLRFETTSDYFKPAPVSSGTFADLLRSPELLERVGAQARPPIPSEILVKHIKIDAERSSDVVNVQLAARDTGQAVDLLNDYLLEAVKFTKTLQSAEAGQQANEYLKRQVEQMDEDILALHQQFRASPATTGKLTEIGGDLSALNQNLKAGPRDPQVTARQNERLQVALSELNELTLLYTDINPKVEAKREQVHVLENQIAAGATNASVAGAAPFSTASRTDPPAFNPELDLIRTKLLSLEEGRVLLANRQREAAMFETNPPGLIRVFAPATAKTVESNLRWVKISGVTIFGGLVGFLASIALVLLVEFTDNRLKTVEDVRRVTGLPVLTALGNIEQMKPQDRSQWAFRTWTLLQGRLSPSANQGLVCGITSSAAGEGRSTWIRLLGEAASLTGFRVLTIATLPSPPAESQAESQAESPVPPSPANGHHSAPPAESSALTTNVLTSPVLVTEQLIGMNSPPVVHIPLPGWVWNLERRKQWSEALAHWRTIDNLVILVELPPACIAESVLLGANLPNLLWLTDSGAAGAAETRAQLDTLRHARCNLVGAVLNHEPAASLRSRFPRWLSGLALLALLLPGRVVAQDTNPPVAAETAPTESNTNLSFSIIHPVQRAAWQQRLTLGPGDVLTLGLFGQPELTRTDVAVGPDGRVSFLEAQDVLATGLTIDELRAKLDEAIGQFRRAARTIITPVAFKSKKYYMLGKVMTKGVYTLDRPITVLEAIARAHGLENGLVDRNITDLADYQRSFLMRGGKRYPLDFQKLLQNGDLTQNIAIEPGDYLYFPSANVKEVYVVGEVRLPGPVTFTPDMTLMAAIAARAGYTDRAFKMRVLVVRGAVNHPQVFAVDTGAILSGKTQNFRLQPKDIIYVNSRPFIQAEELADVAVTAFLQSLVTSWVGVNVIQPTQTQ